MTDVEDEPPVIVNNKDILPGFTAKEQRVIVRYLHHMQTRCTEIHKLLEAVCGESAAPYKLVKEWISEDLKGQEDKEEQNKNAYSTATNGAISPKQTLPTDPALVYRMEYLVNCDRRISIDRASDMTMVTKQTAQHVLCDVLGLKKVFERWVPRLWTPEQRAYRVHVAEELMRRHEKEGDEFLDRIIVGDETVAFYYTPNTLRRTSLTMAKGVLGVGEKYRPSIEQVRVYFMVFYDIYGLLLAEEVPDAGENPGVNYADILKVHLTEAYARKRRGKDLRNCILLHDNTAPHCSKKTRTVLNDLGIETLPHPPASPDLEPHEYWIIPYLRNSLKGSTYQEKQVIITALNHHIKHLMECAYVKSIKSLPWRWAQCVDTSGLYVL